MELNLEACDTIDIPIEAIKEASRRDGYELGLDFGTKIGIEIGFYSYFTTLETSKSVFKLKQLIDQFPSENDLAYDYNDLMIKIRCQYKIVKSIYKYPDYKQDDLSF